MVKKKSSKKLKQVTDDGDVDYSMKTPGEKCSKCGNEDFAISKDMYHKRYCTKCSHIWLPKDKKDVVMDNLKADIGRHKDLINTLNIKIDRLEKENKKLKEALGLDNNAVILEEEEKERITVKTKMTTEDIFG